MRTGLFAAGIVIAVVGAGLLVSLFYLPPVPTNVRTASVAITDLGPGTTRSWVISEAVAASGQLSLSWTASTTVAVSLWNTASCPVGGGICSGTAITGWAANVSGVWAYSGNIRSSYLLSVTNSASTSQSFTGVLTETYQVPTPSQAIPAWALISVGGLVLVGIGAIAVFLGLFLGSGVYRPPPTEENPLEPEFAERGDENRPGGRGSRTF